MHDLDQVRTPFGRRKTNREFEDEYEDEFESAEDETYETDNQVYEQAPPTRSGSDLSENELMELATELLAVGDDRELEMFLGSLFKKGLKGIRKLTQSRGFKGFAKIFKPIAKRLLPIAGSALGSIVPGVGTAIGGALGSAAGRLMGLELEGLSPEDQELEVAKVLVLLMHQTASQIEKAQGKVPEHRLAEAAFQRVAKRLAPGLVVAGLTPAPGKLRPNQKGTWVRSRHQIILKGVFNAVRYGDTPTRG